LKKRTLLVIVLGLIAAIVASSLVINEDSVLNLKGSQMAWQRNILNFATAIATSDGKVFTMDISGNVSCYSSQSGKSIWNGSSVGGYFAAGLTVNEGRVFGGYRYASVGCLDETTGQFLWNRLYNAGVNQAPDSLIVSEGWLYVVSEGIDAGVSALNASTGQLLWQATSYYSIFGNITDSRNWWISGYPLGGNAFEGPIVYALGGNSSNPNIFKLDTKNGTIIWQTNLVRFNGIPNVVVNSHNKVIIENGNQFLCLDENSGDQIWRFDVDKSICQPTINQGLLLFGTSGGYFLAVNASNGGLTWITKVDSQNLMFSVNNDNITLTTYPIQVDTESQRLYWSFGVTHQLGTNSENKQDTYTGTVCSLDLGTGNITWTRQLEDSGIFYNTPVGMVLNKDTLFLTENNALWVFSASNGNLARTQHFDHCILAPIVSDDEVFVVSDLQLTAYR
jgi:outer membrane protein assembly factor BamB